LSFTARVEITPEIEVKDYKGIPITYTKPSVTADEIKRQLDSIRESRKIDTMDDIFAKGLGYPSLEELKAVMERQALVSKDNAQRHDIEAQVINHLHKGLKREVAPVIGFKQAQDMLRQAKVDLALKGVPKEKIMEQEATLLKEIQPQAERQVLVYLVLSAIAKKENIPLDDNMMTKVMEFLYTNAKWEIKAG